MFYIAYTQKIERTKLKSQIINIGKYIVFTLALKRQKTKNV